MTTFQPQIVRCPACKQKMYYYELASYTIFHSTVFSDGKADTSPPVYNEGAIRICAKCKQAFWAREAIIETENPYALLDKLPQALDLHDLLYDGSENYNEKFIEYYSELLQQGFAFNREKKLYLRTRLWWAINNLVRYRTPFIVLLKDILNPKRCWYYLRNRQRHRDRRVPETEDPGLCRHHPQRPDAEQHLHPER